MTSRERVLTALRRRQPDRVPVVEFVVDPKVARGAVPGCRDVADGLDRLDLDAVGCGARFDPVETRADGTWVDEWGVLYQSNAEVVAHPLRGPIATLDDLRAYQPPDPEAAHRLGDLPDLVRRYKGRRAIIFHQRAAFMWSAYLNGLDNLLANLVLEPQFCRALMGMVLEVNLAVARRAMRAGADVIVLGDDYAHNAGPLMSPALFRSFLLPPLKTMVQAIHEEGGLVIKHSDGNLYPILADIVASGADGLNPIEPVAGMDLTTTKRLVGDRMALVGNVDCARLLPLGTPAQVRQAVRQCILDAGQGGGYLLSSSNSIHSSVKPENFVAMVNAAQELGTYPLHGSRA
jgi:uroporphyrinogen decarboxylase